MKDEKIIIIGGGVGPQAGTILHNYIIENTLTNGTDQDHLDIYHFSRSSDIPDRTIAIESGNYEEPATGMYRTFQAADAAIQYSGKNAVGGIPCNTFHAPEIFNKFETLMTQIIPKIKIVSMVEETVKEILKVYPGVEKIGIMSTSGTRITKIYSDPFQNNGFEVIQVPAEDQARLHDSIYNKDWGIKAVSPISTEAKSNFENFSRYLINNGAEIIILGCTEIPLALPYKKYKNIPLVDPMLILARALIKEANPGKLKP
jgi:aspartate racemase